MDEEWDADNFTIKKPVVNKWEGEDEDDDVKDSWDAEEEEEDEEEKKDVEKIELKPKPQKKSLSEKVAEKERLRQEEIDRKIKEMEEEMTEEEKLRQQKESDLQLALDTTFGEDCKAHGLDSMHPTTKEEFAEFSELLNKKFLIISKNSEYPEFAEDHIRNVCASLSSADLKKLKITIENMFIEKQKIEKGEKPKKSKGKTKVKLRVEGGNTHDEYSGYADYNDYDDFM